MVRLANSSKPTTKTTQNTFSDLSNHHCRQSLHLVNLEAKHASSRAKLRGLAARSFFKQERTTSDFGLGSAAHKYQTPLVRIETTHGQ